MVLFFQYDLNDTLNVRIEDAAIKGDNKIRDDGGGSSIYVRQKQKQHVHIALTK